MTEMHTGGITRNVAILGSTGSVGTQGLDVASRLKDRFRVTALSAHRNGATLLEQALKHRPERVCLSDPRADVEALRSGLSGEGIEVLHGPEGLLEIVASSEVDTVLQAVVGAAGLPVSLRSLECGKVLALANKESLCLAGSLLMRAAQENGGTVVPVDSEHCAIFQCLRSGKPNEVRRLLLTASGGPFRRTPLSELEAVTPELALDHPTWNMGPRITVDSATMVNKALEVIEARVLFSVPASQVEVVIHPQSILHSMVEFRDGSVIAQLGEPDMRIPIQFALSYPDRLDNPSPPYDPAAGGSLTFEKPDPSRYPALGLGFRAAEVGGTLPAVLNAADEVAVESFLRHEIPYLGIVETLERVMDAHRTKSDPSLEDIFEADRWAREEAVRCCRP